MQEISLIDLVDLTGCQDESERSGGTFSSATKRFIALEPISTWNGGLTDTNPQAKRHKPSPTAVPPAKSTASSVVILDDDDDDDIQGGLEEVVRTIYPLSNSSATVSLRSLQEQFDIIDLTENSDDEGIRPREDENRFEGITHAISSSDLQVGELIEIDPHKPIAKASVRLDGNNFAPGKTVEFADNTFLRIHTVQNSDSDEHSLVLTGHSFIRQKAYGAKAPKRHNDVIWVGDLRKVVHTKDFVRFRQLIMTNRRYPEMSPRDHPDSWADTNVDIPFGPLFCRWKCTSICDGTRLVEETWRSLYPEEADPHARVLEEYKRNCYRGSVTVQGGSHSQLCLVCDDTGAREESFRQYTFGDAFCGAGGTSCGARMAGMRLAWAFDYDTSPVATYRLNFPEAECLELPVHSFIDRAKSTNAYQIDVLHISPPCQPFSPAHTVPSQLNDEKNQAALFSVGELIESVKPRIVTIEETEGLVSRHGQWFAALINMFLRAGYSFTWKIIKCSDYGIPQLNRKRLMLIAAGPGEVLPKFPPPTHAVVPSGTLKRTPTIGDRISNLDGLPDHDVSNLRRVPQAPFSANSYAHTLTCNSGVGNYHPSGLRNYTVRELACLQTFPRNFRFANVAVTRQKRQIGNAVPPELSQVIMKAIIKSLQRTDGIL